MDLIKKLLGDPKVKGAIIFIIGLVAEWLIGVVNAIGGAPPV